MAKYLPLLTILLAASSSHSAQRIFTRLLPQIKIGIPLAVGLSLTTPKSIFAQGNQDNEPRYAVKLTERDYRALQEVILSKKNEWLATEIEPKSAATGNTYQFSVTQPIPLTAEQEKMDIFERIGNKYIGDLPEPIKDIVAYFHFKKNSDKKTNPLNTTLLYGEPGVGKTYLVKTLAQELQKPYMYCNCTAFNDKYFGESQGKITSFFNTAKSIGGPVFMMIDEIDAIALSRDNNQSCNETLMTLLTEVQNLEDHPEIFIFIASNSPERLDFAMLDRFSNQAVKIEKIQTKEHMVAFFKKSLMDRGFTSQAEINNLAHRLSSKFESKFWGISTPLSTRNLSKIMQQVIARQHHYENTGKPARDLVPLADQIIKQIESAPKPKPKNPTNI